MAAQKSKTFLGTVRGRMIWILSRAFDILPMELKIDLLTQLAGRFSERLLFSGKSRLIKWEISSLSHKVKLRVSNQDDYFALLARGEIGTWEKETLEFWVQATRNQGGDRIAIDVGAYFGLFSIIAALGGGVGRVIAIEPNPNTLPKLRHNIQLNKMSSKIEVEGKACGEHRDFLPLMIPKDRKTSSGAQMEESHLNEKSDWEKAGIVEVVPLDDFLQTHQISSVAAIKIDAEGFELKVLHGAKEILRHSHPVIIVEILDFNLYLKVTDFLQQFGYLSGKPLDGYSLSYEHQNGVDNIEIARNYLFTHQKNWIHLT